MLSRDGGRRRCRARRHGRCACRRRSHAGIAASFASTFCTNWRISTLAVSLTMPVRPNCAIGPTSCTSASTSTLVPPGHLGEPVVEDELRAAAAALVGALALDVAGMGGGVGRHLRLALERGAERARASSRRGPGSAPLPLSARSSAPGMQPATTGTSWNSAQTCAQRPGDGEGLLDLQGSHLLVRRWRRDCTRSSALSPDRQPARVRVGPVVRPLHRALLLEFLEIGPAVEHRQRQALGDQRGAELLASRRCRPPTCGRSSRARRRSARAPRSRETSPHCTS